MTCSFVSLLTDSRLDNLNKLNKSQVDLLNKLEKEKQERAKLHQSNLKLQKKIRDNEKNLEKTRPNVIKARESVAFIEKRIKEGDVEVKRLQKLHEEFIDVARRPMSFGRLPIKPVDGDVAIIPVDKWTTTKDPASMRKTFKFFSMDLRNRFLQKLLQYEVEEQHSAILTVEEDSVMINLYTKDLNSVTELDKEYAKFADILYKDIVYNA